MKSKTICVQGVDSVPSYAGVARFLQVEVPISRFRRGKRCFSNRDQIGRRPGSSRNRYDLLHATRRVHLLATGVLVHEGGEPAQQPRTGLVVRPNDRRDNDESDIPHGHGRNSDTGGGGSRNNRSKLFENLPSLRLFRGDDVVPGVERDHRRCRDESGTNDNRHHLTELVPNDSNAAVSFRKPIAESRTFVFTSFELLLGRCSNRVSNLTINDQFPLERRNLES